MFSGVGVIRQRFVPLIVALAMLMPILAGLVRPAPVEAHAPTVSLDTIVDQDFATFPQTIYVTGTVSHGDQGNVNGVEIKLLIDNVDEFSVTPTGLGTATSYDFSLPWQIEGPATYQVKITAKHGNALGEAGQAVIIGQAPLEEEDVTPPEQVDGLVLRDSHSAEALLIACGGYTNDTEIRLEWNASGAEDLDHYLLYNRKALNDEKDPTIVYDTFYNINMNAANPNPFQYAISAVDSEGNESELSDICEVTLDQTIPVTTLSSPLGSTYWNEPIEIAGNSTDAIGVDEVNLFFKPAGADDSEYALITTIDADDSDSFDWSFDWTPTAEGSYDIKAAATDLAGNAEASAIAEGVTYDVTAPLAEITNPADGSFAAGTVEVRGSVEDENPWRYHVRIEDSSGTPVYAHTTNESSSFTDELLHLWDTTAVPDGIYKIFLEARDLADNKDGTRAAPGDSVDVVTVIVDNTAPTVDAGPDQSLADVLAATLEGSFTELNVDTVVWTDEPGGPGVVVFSDDADPTTGIFVSSFGTYILTLTVTDLAGNTTSDLVEITFTESPEEVLGATTTNNSNNSNSNGNTNTPRNFVSLTNTTTDNNDDDNEDTEEDGGVLDEETDPQVLQSTTDIEEDEGGSWLDWWWLLLLGLLSWLVWWFVFAKRSDEDDE